MGGAHKSPLGVAQLWMLLSITTQRYDPMRTAERYADFPRLWRGSSRGLMPTFFIYRKVKPAIFRANRIWSSESTRRFMRKTLWRHRQLAPQFRVIKHPFGYTRGATWASLKWLASIQKSVADNGRKRESVATALTHTPGVFIILFLRVTGITETNCLYPHAGGF